MNSHPGTDWNNHARWVFGTVLDDGESHTSDRVWSAAGPAAVVIYHLYYEAGYDLTELPNGLAWKEMLDNLSADQRHLLLHKGHLMEISEQDDRYIPRETVLPLTYTGSIDEIRARLEELAAAGINEVVYQPEGPDIVRELTTFAEVAA